MSLKILSKLCYSMKQSTFLSCINQYASQKNTKTKHVELDPFLAPYSKSPNDQQRLYVWGMAEHGALGDLKIRSREKKITFLYRPVRLRFAYSHKITDVACGYGFTVYAVESKNYKLFGSGLNADSQIGYHDPRRGHPLGIILANIPIQVKFKYSDTRIKAVAAGRAHTLLLTSTEGVYALGNNSFGQCGRKIIDNEDYTKLREANNFVLNEGISKVVCGQDHSLFVTKSGRVYACGWGADGQTGLGHYKNESNPTLIEGDIKDENIVKVSSSADCCLALNDKGEVFGWGNSEYGQLLLDQNIYQVNTPRALSLNKTVGKVIDIATSGSSCIVLNDEGTVFVWGFGILGKGPEFKQTSTPSPIPPTLFGRNEFNPSTSVKSVYGSLFYMAAITTEGNLYTWGKNKWGQLGLGHLKDQYFPLKSSNHLVHLLATKTDSI
ncbi:RCC1-like G exchanging factor-like protein isoform X2 [Daktulosphaira vitifoliae]|uniref:RCC1-like G exchanging factor-like protein isoform X2 n=1 Tax=Daktulosphaira vitifoliae TaxID=58002 RepID=UPI0021AA0F35|nr:RCC1-like G exchanging factor-like protein isoform X2 [Daktulosphaira vitifoliae]